MKKTAILFVGLVVIFLAVDAHALAVTLNDSVRYVNAEATAIAGFEPLQHDYHYSQTFTAGNFSTVESSTASASDDIVICLPFSSCAILGTVSASATAIASQDTNLLIGSDSLAVSGNVSVFLDSSTDPYPLFPQYQTSASADGLSLVDLIFNIDSAAQYAFTLSAPSAASKITMQNLDTSDWVLYGVLYPWSGTMGAGNYEFKFWMDEPGNTDFSFSIGKISSNPVYEPTTILLFGSGLAGLGIMRKRMKG